MDAKQRKEFDAELNSGIGNASWAQIEARAWERLEAGEFDRGTSLAQDSQDPPTQGGGE